MSEQPDKPLELPEGYLRPPAFLEHLRELDEAIRRIVASTALPAEAMEPREGGAHFNWPIFRK